MQMSSDVQRKYLEINLYCTWAVVTERYAVRSVCWSKETVLVLTYVWLTANADSQTKGIHAC